MRSEIWRNANLCNLSFSWCFFISNAPKQTSQQVSLYWIFLRGLRWRTKGHIQNCSGRFHLHLITAHPLKLLSLSALQLPSESPGTSWVLLPSVSSSCCLFSFIHPLSSLLSFLSLPFHLLLSFLPTFFLSWWVSCLRSVFGWLIWSFRCVSCSKKTWELSVTSAVFSS